jgi:hypothetical protein
MALPAVRRALERLAFERPFLLMGRYAADRAEIRYWEEASSLPHAASMALQVWREHRHSAHLPPWAVAGLEVVDRETYHSRSAGADRLHPALTSAGDIRPF